MLLVSRRVAFEDMVISRSAKMEGEKGWRRHFIKNKFRGETSPDIRGFARISRPTAKICPPPSNALPPLFPVYTSSTSPFMDDCRLLPSTLAYFYSSRTGFRWIMDGPVVWEFIKKPRIRRGIRPRPSRVGVDTCCLNLCFFEFFIFLLVASIFAMTGFRYDRNLSKTI